MEKVIELLNRMQADGVIEKFAIGGGIAAIYYLEPHSTEGIDVFLSSIILDETGFVLSQLSIRILKARVTMPNENIFGSKIG